MNKVVFIIIVIASLKAFGQTTYNISNPEQLEDLNLNAGDTVILADGTYSSDERIKFSPSTGTADLPITFRAATPGGVVFTGGLQMDIGGDHVIVDGFHWKGGYGASNFIQFRDGSDYANFSKIQNCVIDGLAIHPDDIADDQTNNSITKHRWIVLYGTNNTVTNCSFMNKESAGALILVELYYNAQNNSCATVGHTISNNYFYKYAKIDASLSNSGDSETIRIGSSNTQNVHSNTTVSNNYFVEADGENEIITNKSKNNSFINNTFRRCRGSLVLRHGSDAIVNGNYFLGENVDGTGGIRISDSNHTITNNYIQDCITVLNQAKWNNGITFIGGGANAAIICTATDMSNGYQKSNNVTITNNSIVNTNAPLFYNADKGSNDVTGTFSNNLIYFSAENANVSDVISGDEDNSYSNFGTSINYSDNVFTGTNLGVTNAGFTEELEISAAASGEIFTFSGTGSSEKGANLASYTPTNDDEVGYGIGACFLNNLGVNISDGNCTIKIVESLSIGSLTTLEPSAESYQVSVTANVGWSVTSNDTWITLDKNSGTGNETVTVSVSKNETTNERTGSVTFTQNPGGEDIVKTLIINQKAADLTSIYDLINTGANDDPVTIHSFSKEEVNGTTKFNYAANTLDKDNNTVWAADDGSILTNDYKGDGEYIIYDLGSTYSLKLIQFSTTNKSDAFGFQIWVSTSGTNASDFVKVLPNSEDLLLTSTNTTDFNQLQLNTNARYVKLIGFGRFDSTGTSRKSVWSAVGEIEFYQDSSLSVVNSNLLSEISIYPNPLKEVLYIKSSKQAIKIIKLYTINGRKIFERQFSNPIQTPSIDISKLEKGVYFINIGSHNHTISKKIIISE